MSNVRPQRTPVLERFFSAITDLPVIVQGALGSALFAALLFAGQRLGALVSRRLARSSRERRRAYLIGQQIKYTVMQSKDFAARGALLGVLLYRASRPLFQALLWLSLGLALGTVHQVLGIVGYCGCIYHLFSGLNVVAPPESVPDIAVKLASIKAELEKLNEA
jgi:hypothetical protein